jgi:hypothetical protein
VQSSQRRGRVTRENIAKMWKIGLGAAANTLKATTQLVIRHALHPLHSVFEQKLPSYDTLVWVVALDDLAAIQCLQKPSPFVATLWLKSLLMMWIL